MAAVTIQSNKIVLNELNATRTITQKKLHELFGHPNTNSRAVSRLIIISATKSALF